MSGWSYPREAIVDTPPVVRLKDSPGPGREFPVRSASLTWTLGARFLEGPDAGEVVALGGPTAFPRGGKIDGYKVEKVRTHILTLTTPWEATE